MIDCHVCYLDQEMPGLRMDLRGDWVDVRASWVKINGQLEWWQQNLPGLVNHAEGLRFRQWDEVLIGLGFAMHFPAVYEAHILPRSSLYKRTGLILVNSMGLVDHTYKGDYDEWVMPCLALRDGMLRKYERVGQFRLINRMLPLDLTPVSSLQQKSRGGYGSTGAVEYVATEDDGYQD